MISIWNNYKEWNQRENREEKTDSTVIYFAT